MGSHCHLSLTEVDFPNDCNIKWSQHLCHHDLQEYNSGELRSKYQYWSQKTEILHQEPVFIYPGSETFA